MADAGKIKLVKFQKNYDEALGITLRVNEKGYCIVARILHGGLIHQQGLLHIGDRIVEVNGMDVKGLSVEALQKMLKDSYGNICLKIITGFRCPQSQCEVFIRALFDYDPLLDDLIPCPQAGIPFCTRDILQVISKDDQSWWQARHWSPPPCPSPPLQHRASISFNEPHSESTKFKTVPSHNNKNKNKHSHNNNNNNFIIGNHNFPPFMANSINAYTLPLDSDCGNNNNNNNINNDNNNNFFNNSNTIHKFTYKNTEETSVDDDDDDEEEEEEDGGGNDNDNVLFKRIEKMKINNNNQASGRPIFGLGWSNDNNNNFNNSNNNFNDTQLNLNIAQRNAIYNNYNTQNNYNNNNNNYNKNNNGYTNNYNNNNNPNHIAYNPNYSSNNPTSGLATPPFSTTSSSSCWQPSGLIPSPELQEWRLACSTVEKNNKFQCSWFGLKKRLHRCTGSNKGRNVAELLTYEEVIFMPFYPRKTIVLLGAHGVGRRHIKNTLINTHPSKFAYPVPHTTRKARKDEENGRSFIFITHEQMMADIAANKYLEYGTHDDCMYGTKLETIRNIHNTRLVAVLDVEPQLLGTKMDALKTLRNAEYAPYIVFISPPNVSPTFDEDNLESLMSESEELEAQYGAFFDLKVVNNDTDSALNAILHHFELCNTTPQWIPISWVF